MVLPQGIAGAMTPFPERAGAASSLFGFVQQSVAAVCGAAVGWFLGHDAWPLALGVVAMGCATLGLWLATRGIAQAAPQREMSGVRKDCGAATRRGHLCRWSPNCSLRPVAREQAVRVSS